MRNRIELTWTVALVVLGGVSHVASAGDDIIDIGRGPVVVHIPSSYDGVTPVPLLLLLHGYTSTGAAAEAYLQFAPVAEEAGMLYLHPDGTEDSLGNPFWNATDACCDLFGSGVDDSGYLRTLIDTVRDLYVVDDRRIYLAGHSNGGFMSYRMACDHADLIAAVASLAGATWLDPADCQPSEPVHVLQIHGTSDTTIFYNGGCLASCYPGALETVELWADSDGCSLTPAPGLPLDLVPGLRGAETEVLRYEMGCLPGGSAELWSIQGGGHSPAFSGTFAQTVVDFLLAHPEACVGDFDGSGTIDTTDLLALLAAWGPCPEPCPQNLDGRPGVGAGDLLMLLSRWGDC